MIIYFSLVNPVSASNAVLLHFLLTAYISFVI